MAKYSLCGVDGNAYALMGYTMNALNEEGLSSLVELMLADAKSSDYYHLITVCSDYIAKANAEAIKNGYVEEE